MRDEPDPRRAEPDDDDDALEHSLPLVEVPEIRPGAAPGIENHPEVDVPPEEGAVRIACIDFGPDALDSGDVAVPDLEAFLARPRPASGHVRWINVDGLNAFVVNRIRAAFGLHSLAAEDVLSVPQRPKVEAYEQQLFVVARMLRIEDGDLVSEQVSFFLLPDTLLSFQERVGDVWDPVRKRILEKGRRIRDRGADYLLYALLDALIDHCFPILEHYGDELEDLERDLVASPGASELHRLHRTKGQLLRVRQTVWPMRAVADELWRSEHPSIEEHTTTYLRDVHDHALRIIDILEAYRELAGSLTDLYMTSVSNRTNEVMRVLTILASLFIPVTFLAGVYGMNFQHIPELDWRYAYPTFWIACIAITAGLLVFFRRRGWL